MDRKRPTLCIVAGPNGSGKTSFYGQVLIRQFPHFVNADHIALSLTDIAESGRGLAAARLAEEQRERLIAEGVTFAFETVFSRTEHWIGFLRGAKERGYHLALYFLCTENPDLNAARVKTRSGRGGHAVPLDKVVARYPRSIRTALEAKNLVDELWLYDTTAWNSRPLLLGWWAAHGSRYLAPSIPRWAEPFFR